MPGLSGRLTKPNKLSPAERGVRQGITQNIARNGAASVNKQIHATLQADATERETLLTQFEVAGKSVPQELLEQLDMRSELRKQRATFEAADGSIAAQYTKQFDPVVMAENERILGANIADLSRDVTSVGEKIERKGKLVKLAKGLADLQQTRVETEGKGLDNALKSFQVADEEITRRMDAAFGGVDTAEIYKMIEDGRMASLNVPLGQAHRYVAKRRKDDIDNQIAELGLRKNRALTLTAENKLRTSKTNAQKAQKQQFLLGLNTTELQALSREIRSAGSFTVDGVTVNQVDVATALETVQTSGNLMRELKLESYGIDIAADALITEMNEVGRMMNTVYGGGGEEYAAMTVDDLAQQREQFQSIAALQMPDDATGQEAFVNKQMQGYIEEMEGKSAELRKNAIARTPEKARPALLDATLLGYINDSGTAIAAMEENLPAFATIEKGSFYSQAGRIAFNAVTSGASNNAATTEDEKIAALLGGGKDKKQKIDSAFIASKLSDEVVGRQMMDSVTGRIAQGGTVSAFGAASNVLSEQQRQLVGQALFDQNKQGLKADYLLPDREQQINWATAVPEIADMIVASQDGPQEDRLAQLENFFEAMQLAFVDPATKMQVTQAAKPRTLPEHQLWANTRVVNDAVMPFADQVGNMLQMEAADLAVHVNAELAMQREKFATQDRKRERARAREERSFVPPIIGGSGVTGVERPILSDSEFAARRVDDLSRARQRAAEAATQE